MSNAALIFSHSITPRLQYIIDFLAQYYGLSFGLTSDEERFKTSQDTCKINYGYHRLIPGEIFIHAHVLLTESYIRPVRTECFEKNPFRTGEPSYKAFFRTEGDWGFDIFAAIFYLITRYEEYLPHHHDAYGRYDHKQSLAYREGFLHLPLVNIWLEDFRHFLSVKNPEFSIPHGHFEFLPTYDIDMAWSYRNKGFKRNAGALALLFIKLKWRSLARRILVLRKKKQDPYDAFEWMEELHQKFRLHPVYFFLVAKEKGRYDKNTNPDHPEFRRLITKIAERYPVGLHPSWHSGDHPMLLFKEKKWLESCVNHPVNISRQHYIRFELPITYQRLLATGIMHDHSMGYGSINGFRASIATVYNWYDLKKEEKTSLHLHPFCFMDANAYYEQKLSPQAAAEELKSYYEVIRSVHGAMITIWHNSFLGTDEQFAGWKEEYEGFIAGVTKVNSQ